MFRASHFKSQCLQSKFPRPDSVSRSCQLAVAWQSNREAKTMTRFLFQLCASGQIANLHSTWYALKVYLPFPFTLNVWHAKEMHVWHTKNWENQRRFTESKALPDLQPLHVVDPIRWSGLSFRHWLVTTSWLCLQDLENLIILTQKKTCQKKGMNFAKPEKLRIFGRSLFAVFVWEELRFS